MALRQCLEPLGGLQSFVRPGQRVLLQVNLASPSPPEDAVCTHPAIVRAVCRLVREVGGTPAVGGSAAGVTAHRTQQALKASGILDAATAEGAEVLNYDEIGGRDIDSGGALLGKLHIARPVLETDVLTTLPKMKTHGLTLLTGAVKNHMGVLPGARKSELHRLFPDPKDFGEALLDMYTAAPPHLATMDTVQGMDGDGPAGGRVRDVGLLAASAYGVALDAVMCAVAGLDAEWVPTLAAARKRGIGVASLEGIEVLGIPLEEAGGRVSPFVYPTTYRLATNSWPPIWGRRLLLRQFNRPAKPIILTRECTGWRTCFESCPVKAITMVGKKALIEQKECIACLCCHEVCRWD